MSNLLVIDDDPLVHHRFLRDFEDLSIEVQRADTATEGLEQLANHHFDLVILDVMLPDMSGLEAFERIRKLDSRLPVIFITAGSESGTAIEAMKLGAYDYLMKPLDRQRVRDLVQRALEISRLMQVPVALAADDGPPDGSTSRDLLVGRCRPMQEVYKAIGRVASQDVTVLIQGESGTGKELVARAIYQHSRRSDGPFLAINCAAIPESLLESELFGHEKGAFTGADQQRIGKFEQCSGGTLFLDEIGDMTPATQSKVLRLLQEQRFERVGGNETVQTDVRIIAATHHNLKESVGRGRFRSDLFYRLNVFTISVPPLRSRDGDLQLLLKHFVRRFSHDLDRQVTGISEKARQRLLQYHWPGNVRELQSVLKQAILRSTGPQLLTDFLPESIRLNGEEPPVAAVPQDGEQSDGFGGVAETWEAFFQHRIEEGVTDLYDQSIAMLERSLLTYVLRHTGGNQLQAAKLLGVTRGTLRNKIRALGITIDRTVASPSSTE